MTWLAAVYPMGSVKKGGGGEIMPPSVYKNRRYDFFFNLIVTFKIIINC